MPELIDLRRLHANDCEGTCITSGCERDGCVLPLPPRVTSTVSCDHCKAFSQNEARPDFVVLVQHPRSGRSFWCIVEMKSGSLEPEDTHKQLKAGAIVVRDDHRFGISDAPSIVIPIVLKKGKLHAADFSDFKGRTVEFQSKKRGYPIIVKGCGTPLQEILNTVVKQATFASSS